MTVDVPLHLERAGPIPVAQQLSMQVQGAIVNGQLHSGARLPSTCTLARVLNVSRGAEITAYEDLLATGYLVGRVEAGIYVSQDVPVASGTTHITVAAQGRPAWLRGQRVLPEVTPPAGSDIVIDFRVGQPAVARLSDAAWKRAWRRVAEEA